MEPTLLLTYCCAKDLFRVIRLSRRYYEISLQRNFWQARISQDYALLYSKERSNLSLRRLYRVYSFVNRYSNIPDRMFYLFYDVLALLKRKTPFVHLAADIMARLMNHYPRDFASGFRNKWIYDIELFNRREFEDFFDLMIQYSDINLDLLTAAMSAQEWHLNLLNKYKDIFIRSFEIAKYTRYDPEIIFRSSCGTNYDLLRDIFDDMLEGNLYWSNRVIVLKYIVKHLDIIRAELEDILYDQSWNKNVNLSLYLGLIDSIYS